LHAMQALSQLSYTPKPVSMCLLVTSTPTFPKPAIIA